MCFMFLTMSHNWDSTYSLNILFVTLLVYYLTGLKKDFFGTKTLTEGYAMVCTWIMDSFIAHI